MYKACACALTHLQHQQVDFRFKRCRERTKGSLLSTTAGLMVFKLVIAASRTWLAAERHRSSPKNAVGVRFKDGIEVFDVPKKQRRLIAPRPHKSTKCRVTTISKITTHSSVFSQSISASVEHDKRNTTERAYGLQAQPNCRRCQTRAPTVRFDPLGISGTQTRPRANAVFVFFAPGRKASGAGNLHVGMREVVALEQQRKFIDFARG